MKFEDVFERLREFDLLLDTDPKFPSVTGFVSGDTGGRRFSPSVHAVSVHTERGFHMKEVQSWKAWARSVKLGKVKLTPAEAKAQLDAGLARINLQFGAKGPLPWQ